MSTHPLDEVEEFLRRFVAYPSEAAATAHVLWIAHTHLIDAFDNTPRLAFLSPEPGSGKSRALEVTEPLVPRPVVTVNSTPAYVFRKISDDAGLPTLLFDEVDAVFGQRPSDASEDLRGLLNSGYRRGATAGRAVVRGKEVMTEELPSFCAVAMAGLNQLPDTIMTRSIIIRMRRRKSSETVMPYRRRVYRAEGEALYGRLAQWAATAVTDVTDSWPTLPHGVEDRDADVWEPLLAVAEAAGGSWVGRARETAAELVAASKETGATLGIKLLGDIRTVLDGRHSNPPSPTVDRISTVSLLDALHSMETAPWGSIKGEPIDSRFLSRILSKYDIPTNNTIRLEGDVFKGYARHHFHDAWDRYTPADEVATPGHLATELPPAEPVPSPEVGNAGNAGNGLCPVCGEEASAALESAKYVHPGCEVAA